MAQILGRNVESEVVERLKRRASRNGRSLEAEVRAVLTQAAGFDYQHSLRELIDLQASFEGKTFSDSTDLLREDRAR